ncbi:DUF550 domain-containing protein [Enterobacter asburiae]|uniref:DUF550 domain-containing protein n=1 Tax=Enterobacter asburiae TaxID=61645 RepID=UPI002B2563C2|nr:DUF550 domain-containing protein [Enterobacter asburiae]MEB2410998.1 DUF550 domain-containing protein [Enterobacter asburiae]
MKIKPFRVDGGDIGTGRIREIADNPYGDEEKCWLAKRVLALQAELEAEKGASLQLRNLIRQRHAEWSDKTFGNVGPVGPLKHLSKEALEAAADPNDLSEWADMQFLLWDAQRRAGINDGEITAAMEEKLKVNMARQWPEPKDGEPRLHIKTGSNSPVIPDGRCPCCGRKQLKSRTCSVTGCEGKHVAHGFCKKHYDNERKKDPSRRESIRAADERYRARKSAASQQEVK